MHLFIAALVTRSSGKSNSYYNFAVVQGVIDILKHLL